MPAGTAARQGARIGGRQGRTAAGGADGVVADRLDAELVANRNGDRERNRQHGEHALADRVAQAANQFFQVDMLSPRTFGAIRLDTTATPTEFPGSYKVQVANDNVSWGTAPNIATGSGAAVTTVSFAPQTARYIRITLTPGTSGPFWSIHEFNVYDTRLSRTNWTATASPNNGNAGLAIDAAAGTRWTRWSGPTTRR